MKHEYGYFEDDHLGQMGDFSLWRRLLSFTIPWWKWVLLAVFLSFLVTLAGLALPRLTQLAMDLYIIPATLDLETRFAGLSQIGTAFLLVILIGFGANLVQVVTLEWTGQNIMHSIRQQLFSHILKLDLSFFNTNPVGRLVTRLTNDIQNMYEMFTSVIITLFNDAVRLIGILVMLFWMNWKLAFLLSLIFPVMILVTVWFGRLSRDAFRMIRTHLASINSFLQESIAGVSVIQLFSRENDFRERFKNFNEKYLGAAVYQIKIFGVFMPLIEVMSSVSLALIIWFGGKEILSEHMSLGELTAFISYMRLFFQPVRELSQKYSIVQSAMASAERIFHLLESREMLPEPRHPLLPSRLMGSISFRNVEFAYEADQPVIRNLSFEVRPGEILAVVGATGSGKTTLINLLERFYDPLRGEIRLDGVDLKDLDIHWLRNQIGLVMQDVFIIPGTIRENILLDRELGDDKVKEIVELSQLAGFVKSLPQGLDTKIGEGAMDLSAGQKQLLALARVLARNPRILVLDEATANVDSETEMLLEQAVQAALKDRTSIIIAHRLSTIRRAHRILVMDRGRIVEEGTHEDLMKLRGLYYHLQSLQQVWADGA